VRRPGRNVNEHRGALAAAPGAVLVSPYRHGAYCRTLLETLFPHTARAPRALAA